MHLLYDVHSESNDRTLKRGNVDSMYVVGLVVRGTDQVIIMTTIRRWGTSLEKESIKKPSFSTLYLFDHITSSIPA